MSPRTTFLARLIGLYDILVALAMITHRQAAVAMVTALLHDAPLLFLAAIMALGIGLAMVLGHNVWSGGALPVVVTLVGWTSVLKGVLFLYLSPDAASSVFLGALHYEQLFYAWSAFSLLLGIYLTYASARRA